MSLNRSFRSRTRGWTADVRLKASNCFVNEVPRSIAFLMFST